MDQDDLKQRLTPEQYRVTQEKGTEAPFTGEYVSTTDEGLYNCVVCGEALFESESKYDPGCGWPSFWAPKTEAVIKENEDVSHGMSRTEVVCHKCGAHLGHVFPDGPKEHTGQRYCINSAALTFKSKDNG